MKKRRIRPYGTVRLDGSIYKSLSEGTKLTFQVVFPSLDFGVLIIDVFTSEEIRSDVDGWLIVKGSLPREWVQKIRQTATVKFLFRAGHPSRATYIIDE